METSIWPRPTACSPRHGPSASASTTRHPVPHELVPECIRVAVQAPAGGTSSAGDGWSSTTRTQRRARGPLPPRLRPTWRSSAAVATSPVGPTPIASCRARTISPSTSRTSRRSSSRASSAGPTKRSPGDAGRDVRLDPAGGLELHARRPRRGLGTAWTTCTSATSPGGRAARHPGHGQPGGAHSGRLLHGRHVQARPTRRPVEITYLNAGSIASTRARAPSTRRVAALSGPA